jgi:hypothetical protein
MTRLSSATVMKPSSSWSISRHAARAAASGSCPNSAADVGCTEESMNSLYLNTLFVVQS